MCKHNLASGCFHCHAQNIVDINGAIREARRRMTRTARAQRYAAKLALAMHREGPLAVNKFRNQYTPITRNMARWTMNQYAGN